MSSLLSRVDQCTWLRSNSSVGREAEELDRVRVVTCKLGMNRQEEIEQTPIHRRYYLMCDAQQYVQALVVHLTISQNLSRTLAYPHLHLEPNFLRPRQNKQITHSRYTGLAL